MAAGCGRDAAGVPVRPFGGPCARRPARTRLFLLVAAVCRGAALSAAARVRALSLSLSLLLSLPAVSRPCSALRRIPVMRILKNMQSKHGIGENNIQLITKSLDLNIQLNKNRANSATPTRRTRRRHVCRVSTRKGASGFSPQVPSSASRKRPSRADAAGRHSDGREGEWQQAGRQRRPQAEKGVRQDCPGPWDSRTARTEGGRRGGAARSGAKAAHDARRRAINSADPADRRGIPCQGNAGLPFAKARSGSSGPRRTACGAVRDLASARLQPSGGSDMPGSACGPSAAPRSGGLPAELCATRPDPSGFSSGSDMPGSARIFGIFQDVQDCPDGRSAGRGHTRIHTYRQNAHSPGCAPGAGRGEPWTQTDLSGTACSCARRLPR